MLISVLHRLFRSAAVGIGLSMRPFWPFPENRVVALTMARMKIKEPAADLGPLSHNWTVPPAEILLPILADSNPQ